jgi:hypothetical protein
MGGVMVDIGELSLVAVSTNKLTEGIKFLYGQAAELLKRIRERADQKATVLPPLAAEGPLDVLDGSLDPCSVDESRVDDHTEELTEFRHRLVDYVDGVAAVSPDDRELLSAVDTLRRPLELVYGQHITFVGEQRPATGTVLNTEDISAANRPQLVVAASGPGAIAIGRDNTGTAETHVNEY